MAGDKDTTNYIIRGVPSTIQPVCSSGLTFIWDSSNNYWYYNHESTTTFPLTISATGYVSQTITTSTSSGGYYWIDVTLKPENLYAWTVDTANENKITPSSYRTLYTSLQNLSDVQDFYSIKFYNSLGEEIDVHNIYHEDDPLDDVYDADNEKVQLRFDM